VSEVDVDGQVLATYSDVSRPGHLSIDSEDRVLVADYLNDHILLLSSQLELEHVFIDKTNTRGKLCGPWRLSYNERLYVAHRSKQSLCDVISQFNVDWVTDSSLILSHSLLQAASTTSAPHFLTT